MKVLFVSYEVTPIYKFGGLGDVAGSLPKALKNKGIDIHIGMPLYRDISKTEFLPNSRVPVIFAESELFQKSGIIGNNKNPRNRVVAFVHFSQKILDTIKKIGFAPDLIHLNEWHAGLVPLLLKTRRDDFFQNTKTLVTIHNSLYQGIFLISDILKNPHTHEIGLLIKQTGNKFVNLTELSLQYADWVSTVSPAYAKEILTGKFDFGLAKIIRPKKDHFVGILNGLDTDIWNPALDVFIPQRYSLNSVGPAKAKNKAVVQRKLGLTVDATTPVFSFIARLVWQKGLDVLLPLLPKLTKLPLQCVVLGSGDRDVVSQMQSISRKLPGKIAIISQYEERLAHELFAAADFFLMPSIFEPCGLTQLMAMAYGTLPIVSKIGGLKDTVKDGVTGFFIEKHTVPALLEGIDRALKVWNNKNLFDQMRNAAINQDFSWEKSADKYFKLYQKILNSG